MLSHFWPLVVVILLFIFGGNILRSLLRTFMVALSGPNDATIDAEPVAIPQQFTQIARVPSMLAVSASPENIAEITQIGERVVVAERKKRTPSPPAPNVRHNVRGDVVTALPPIKRMRAHAALSAIAPIAVLTPLAPRAK